MEWISVDDRLPEEWQGDVIIYNGDVVASGYYHRWARTDDGKKVIGFDKKFQPKDQWEFSGEGFICNPQPTHWMPLPEPPKEGA